MRHRESLGLSALVRHASHLGHHAIRSNLPCARRAPARDGLTPGERSPRLRASLVPTLRSDPQFSWLRPDSPRQALNGITLGENLADAGEVTVTAGRALRHEAEHRSPECADSQAAKPGPP